MTWQEGLFDAAVRADKSMDGSGWIETLPVSVIETGEQETTQRGGHHDAKSSRAEFSPFPREVGKLAVQLFLRDAKVVFDPFAGWGERGRCVLDAGKQYIGVDCNQDAVDSAARLGVPVLLGDSEELTPPPFDGLLTCPPYWNLEQYNEGFGLDSAQTFEEFCVRMEDVWGLAYRSASSGATFVVMSGAWRANGVFHDLPHAVKSAFMDLGAVMVDDLCVSRLRRSKVKVMIPQAVRLGYTVRVHESLLVVRKP